MKTATYTIVLKDTPPESFKVFEEDPHFHLEGDKLTVEYDDEAPCQSCGLPVYEASVAGSAICPWCDMGTSRTDPYGRAPTRKATDEEYQVELVAYHAAKAVA